MIVGIDLGTTFSLISKIGRNGVPELLPDIQRSDMFSTPSIINLEDNQAYLGELLEKRLEREPGLPLIKFFKRHFGERESLYIDTNGDSWYPEGLAALLLKKLVLDAEAFESEKVEGAVVTVPAHFSDKQRKAVLNAAAIIDLPILGLLEEPIAAALHYGVSQKSFERSILVYDLGGGTFDVTVLSMDREGVYVKAKDGHTEIGGKEFDEAIGQIILEQFEEAYGHEPSLDARSVLYLRRFSEQLKIELCLPGNRFVEKICLLGNRSLEVNVRRKDFEKRITEHLAECERIVLRCIHSANMEVSDIETVLLVGGSSMVPLIRKRLKEVFKGSNQQILTHEPMRAVVYGAALHAIQVSGQPVDFDLPPELQGVTGHNLGVRAIDPNTNEPIIDTLVRKNTPLPSYNRKTYFTGSAEQKKMRLEIVQYIEESEREIALGSLAIGPLPSNEANYPIQIEIEQRKDGTVWFVARDERTGTEIEKVFGDEEDDISYLPRQKEKVLETYVNGHI